MSSLPAVVLAGGKSAPQLVAYTGYPNRALVPVDGKPLLRHVVDALALRCSPILVIGPAPQCPDYESAEDQGDFVSNIMLGLRRVADAELAVIATADLPYITPAAVDSFITQAEEQAARHEADLVLPVVSVSLCLERYPNIRRTSLRLREGGFTAGNMALVRPKALLGRQAIIAAAYKARKSPARLARMLGAAALLRLAGARLVRPSLLDIRFIETQASRLIGLEARALVCRLPEIATDLDRVSDFEAAGVRPARQSGCQA